MSASLEPQLRAGLAELQLQLADEQVRQLLEFVVMLQKWNKVYNLTAVQTPAEMVTHHLLDSLAVVPALLREMAGRPFHLLDVGSGGGLPGVVIAVSCLSGKVDCVDAVGKKAAFVRQVAAALPLPNLRSLHARVEKLAGQYDVVTSRAFASIADFVNGSSGALAKEGVWMAMKGKLPADEIALLPAEVTVFHVEQLTVPGLAAERCLVWLRRAAAVT